MTPMRIEIASHATRGECQTAFRGLEIDDHSEQEKNELEDGQGSNADL